jgi:hypothetical protein
MKDSLILAKARHIEKVPMGGSNPPIQTAGAAKYI